MGRRKESEFGKGCTYCLGLFLCHADAFGEQIESYKRSFAGNAIGKDIIEHQPYIWFNGASDHLYELEVPDSFPPALKKRLERFREKVLDYGHGKGLMCQIKLTKDDVYKMVKEAKDLLRLIDKQVLKVETVKGDWE